MIRRGKKEKGQGLVEYALILGLVAVASIVIISLVGPSINRSYGVVVGSLHGKKNASSVPAGSTNIIYVTGTTNCAISGSTTVVNVTLQTSSDILKEDIVFSMDNKIVPSSTTGAVGTWAAQVQVAAVADKTKCPQSIVITAKNAIAIIPVT